MPQKVIKFAGINRAVNEFQNTGACEELINLRPKVGGGHNVIKDKNVVLANVQYDSIYEHSFGDTTNLIATREGRVFWVKEDGKEDVITYDLEYEGNAVTVCSAGNVLLAYSETLGEQKAFKFESGAYKPYEFKLRRISSVKMNERTDVAYSYSAIAEDDTVAAYNAALQTAASGFYSKFPNGLCGAAVIGCTYELEDGSETWSTGFIVADSEKICTFDIAPTATVSEKKVIVKGINNVRVTIFFDGEQSTSVRKINIYASRPIYPYEVSRVGSFDAGFTKKSLEDLRLDGQLMYYQGSVEPAEESATITLNFGPTQAGEAVMKVMSGCIERVGDAIAYNNRFHYYRSKSVHFVQTPTVSSLVGTKETGGTVWVPHVLINDKYIRVDSWVKIYESMPNDFIYPMAGVKKLAFVQADLVDGNPVMRYNEMFTVDLKDSSAYNYSYAFNVTPDIVSNEAFKDEVMESGQHESYPISQSVLWKKEYNAINVSEQYNPFVFPVNYSYSFGGEIKDIVTSYHPISATQVSQFPVMVFTTGGIYALEQGDGTTLYRSTTPLSPYSITDKALATPHGTFFMSSKNLYLLYGSETVCVSGALNGHVDKDIRNNASYPVICSNQLLGEFNFESVISPWDFEVMSSSAILNYDALRNEVYISFGASDASFSYVFNIDTKEFHKIGKAYKRGHNGARYAIEEKGGVKSIVDLLGEHDADQYIFLQSRPFSPEVFYTHLQRLILHTDATLAGNQHMRVSVFGSNNLKDWKCIISAQKKDISLRQIRTNKAATSFKEYVIIISGLVNTATDLSDIITDYTVVTRRLG